MFPCLQRYCWLLFVVLVGLMTVQYQLAYADSVTFGNGFGSKWGDPDHGSNSDVITWTFMADTTTLHPTHPLVVNGEVANTLETSDITSLRNAFDAANGIGSFDQAIENAFATWAAAAPGRIKFQKVATDTGAPAGGNSTNNIPGSYAVDIRIGAFTSVPGTGFAGIGGVGYGPPGNDTNPNFQDALAGDIILNLSGAFFVARKRGGPVLLRWSLHERFGKLGFARVRTCRNRIGTFNQRPELSRRGRCHVCGQFPWLLRFR